RSRPGTPCDVRTIHSKPMSDEARALGILSARGIDVARFGGDARRFAQRIAALDALESPHLEEVCLAFACGEQNAVALSEFERRYGSEFAGALSRLRLRESEIDEVAQTVRERLFVVAPGSSPRILDYAGRGSFVGWLRAVIVRAGIDLR